MSFRATLARLKPDPVSAPFLRPSFRKRLPPNSRPPSESASSKGAADSVQDQESQERKERELLQRSEMAYRGQNRPRPRWYNESKRSKEFFSDNQHDPRYRTERDDHLDYARANASGPFYGASRYRNRDAYEEDRRSSFSRNHQTLSSNPPLDASFFDTRTSAHDLQPLPRRGQDPRADNDAEAERNWQLDYSPGPSNMEIPDDAWGPPRSNPPPQQPHGQPVAPPTSSTTRPAPSTSSNSLPRPASSLPPRLSSGPPPRAPFDGLPSRPAFGPPRGSGLPPRPATGRPPGPPPGLAPHLASDIPAKPASASSHDIPTGSTQVPHPGPPPGPPPAPPPSLPPTSSRRSRSPEIIAWKPAHARTSPREQYLAIAESQESATYFDPSRPHIQPPPPLPLLVLDLNGSLLFRKTASASTNPTKRPYLSSFLQYCLAVNDPSYFKQRHRRGKGAGNGSGQPHGQGSQSEQTAGGQWLLESSSSVRPVPKGATVTAGSDEKAYARRIKAWNKVTEGRRQERHGEKLPHGTHFWMDQVDISDAIEASDEPEPESESDSLRDRSDKISSQPKESSAVNEASAAAASFGPSPPASATARLFVWSSAQAYNVDSMVRAILHPVQAGQLVRCWARDTLLPARLLTRRAASVKDLEIVWNALAIEGEADLNDLAEQRVFGEFRDQNTSSDDDDLASRQALDRTQRPTLNSDGVTWNAGKGWHQHNTLLLDDSVGKAALQPYNHLLIPSFGPAEARATNDIRAGDLDDQKTDQYLDTVLLQTVGVIEHARWQCDVSQWICHGGLGNFAGMRHHGCGDVEFQEADDGSEEDGADDADLRPRLSTPICNRTAHFWEEEGKRALLARRIPSII